MERIGLAMIRIWCGIYYLKAGFPKLSPEYPQKLAELFRQYIETSAVGFYKTFLSGFAIDHVGLFAFLTSFGEVAAGVALILGLFTPYAAIGGAFMSLNYFLATYGRGGSGTGINLTFIVCMVALIISKAGRHYGMDSLITKYWKVPLL